MTRRLRALQQAFWRRTEVAGREVFHGEDLAYRRTRWLARGVYGVGLGTSVYIVRRYAEHQLSQPHEDPLWPLVWMTWLPWEVGVWFVLALSLLGPLAALLAPARQSARVAAFLGFFLHAALWFTYTGVEHRVFALVSVLFWLALIPGLPRAPDPAQRRQALLLVWAAVASVLMFYSMAGVLKVHGLIEAVARGHGFLFDFGEVPGHLLARAHKLRNPPVLSAFLLDHPALARVGFFGVIYVELVSFAVAFRPHLMRWWLFALAGFHLLTDLTMAILFGPAVALLLVLGVTLPFARPARCWRQALVELPLLGRLLRPVLATASRHRTPGGRASGG